MLANANKVMNMCGNENIVATSNENMNKARQILIFIQILLM
jgi:hypothetical protein